MTLAREKFNIFILTGDPKTACAKAHPIVVNESLTDFDVL